MKVYLDDVRQAPEGYTLVRWPDKAIETLSAPQTVSLIGAETGYLPRRVQWKRSPTKVTFRADIRSTRLNRWLFGLCKEKIQEEDGH